MLSTLKRGSHNIPIYTMHPAAHLQLYNSKVYDLLLLRIQGRNWLGCAKTCHMLDCHKSQEETGDEPHLNFCRV